MSVSMPVATEPTNAGLDAIAPDHDGVVRHDWTREQIQALFALPFNDLLFRAHSVHRRFHDPNRVQLSTLLSIKTGGCPEDCSYCPQSARYDTGVEAERLMGLDEVIGNAMKARAAGATRFCMGAAWRSPKGRNFDRVIEMVQAVKAMGMETCVTLGMLDGEQAVRLKEAGLDYYNHNIDTSPDHYAAVITTRTFEDRINTLQNVRDAGINVCCGGIVGLGETESDRAGFVQALANLPEHPQSVPINMLVQVEGTPLHGEQELDPIDFVRTVAVSRIVMPHSTIRLSAGRETMSDELHALAFFAGAASIFYGEHPPTTENPGVDRDSELFDRLGIQPAP